MKQQAKLSQRSSDVTLHSRKFC